MPVACYRARNRVVAAPPVTSGGGTFFNKASTIGNGTVYIPNPKPGYVGPLDLILCGMPSAPGYYWENDRKGGTQGSGQVTAINYQALGDEDSFAITQYDFGTADGRLVLIINGGVNNGKILMVGSGRNHNSFGASAAAPDRSGSKTIPGGTWYNGSCRPYDATIYYTDNTSYPVAAPASYGSARSIKEYKKREVNVMLYGANSPGGLFITADFGKGLESVWYGKSSATRPEEYNTTILPGVVIFGYPDT